MKSLFLLTLVFNLSINKSLQLFNTTLTVTVRDETGNVVEGASVKIFVKEEDYTKETNPAEEGTTDARGVIKFKKLNPQAYFILCRKGDKDNAGGGEKVSPLKKGEFNKITVVIQ